MLADYALRMKSHSLVQRLGFVIDFLGKQQGVGKPLSPDLRKLLMINVGRSVVYLDKRKPKKGALSNDWKIMNNVSREQLLSEIEVR